MRLPTIRTILAACRAPLCVVTLVLALPLAACRDDVVGPESPAPGEAARVHFTYAGTAGGSERRQETRIDSASGRYALLECSSAPIGVPCTTLLVVREGRVEPSTLRELFAAPARGDFRALRASYRGPTNIRPPDGGGFRLEIVRQGTRRVITWEADAALPHALLEYQCLLQAARADPFLCD